MPTKRDKYIQYLALISRGMGFGGRTELMEVVAVIEMVAAEETEEEVVLQTRREFCREFGKKRGEEIDVNGIMVRLVEGVGF